MRCRKLIKRLLATPMRKTDFLFSFALMRATILVGELPVMLGFAWLMFDVGVRGSLLLLVALAALGTFCFAGLGLLTASRATNTETANGLINLVQMPMLMCSGVFFPSEQFPLWMHPIIKILPLTALNDGLRAVMVDGAGPLAVARQALIVAVWGVASFVLALRLFRWR
jgi:ABC-type multidrug transport system permease subunit